MDAHSSSGLGFLFVVPFEIRDLIYRHVLSDKYCYSPQSKPIGLLGASRALRHEATETLYAHRTFQFDYKSNSYNPPTFQEDLDPSQEIVERLDHVVVSIHMEHDSIELFEGEKLKVDQFFYDLFSRLAGTDRVRKTCHIRICGFWYDRPWDKLSFLQDLRRLSAFRNLILELECEAIHFEDVGLVERGPINLRYGFAEDYFGSERHMRRVSLIERKRKELRASLQVTVGVGRSYERKNFRCLEFRPQSAQI